MGSWGDRSHDMAVEEPSSKPRLESRAVPRTDGSGSGHESGMDDQLDVPGPSTGQQDDPADQSSRPIVAMFEPPIGDLTAPYKLPDRIKQLWPESPTPLKHCFTEAMQRKIGAKFRLAVYSHHVLADQKRAVMSVPWHELDYKESTLEQKEKYHSYCDRGTGSWCQYQAHCAAGQRPEDFVKDTTKELGSKDPVPWSHGMYAGMDCLYPQAWAELVYHFEALSCDELMSRCS